MEVRFAAFHDALDRGDAGEMKLQAHSMKSCSAGVGAMALSGLFAELEAINCSCEAGKAMSLIERAEEAFSVVGRALEIELQRRA